MTAIKNINSLNTKTNYYPSNRIIMRRCNLCHEKFQAQCNERYCYQCRDGEEFKFSDWLPELEFNYHEKRSA